ncbi:MAG: serine acetyltransferase [candidate division KSB1 bacterium]|jgi:serine O-acetyltransferase|nr:serine acetyltransferase [candidate division KSB1 bacterium]
MFENVKADIDALAKWNTTPTWKGKIQLVFDAGTHAVLTYRLGHYAHKMRVPVIRHILLILHYFLHVAVHMSSGIDISKEAEIGKGLAIHSFTGVLISRVKMGESCVLAPSVFIAGRKGGLPEIGNNVFFGIGCKVLGNVKIGDNANIGANAVVTKDVPANHTAVGVYPLKIYPNKNNQPEKLGNV